MNRIKTGIAEIDQMIGGFPAGRSILITGDAGSGKTIFGLQFANQSCVDGLKTVYISTEENASDLRLQGKSFGWDLEGFEKNGHLKFMELLDFRAREIETALSIDVDALKGNFSGLLDDLPENTQVLIIDSLGSHTANLEAFEFRDRFDLLVYKLKFKNITALIIFDSPTSKDYNDIALFSAHGAIRLLKRENPYVGRRERAMDIIKMRNTRTPVQLLTYEINSDGIRISMSPESSEDA